MPFTRRIPARESWGLVSTSGTNWVLDPYLISRCLWGESWGLEGMECSYLARTSLK